MTTCHITNVVASERPTQKTWHTLNDKIIKRNSNTQLSAKPAYNLKSEYFLITAEAITENVLVEETERDIHSSVALERIFQIRHQKNSGQKNETNKNHG